MDEYHKEKSDILAITLLMQIIESRLVSFFMQDSMSALMQASTQLYVLKLITRMAQAVTSYQNVQPCPEFFGLLTGKIVRVWPRGSLRFILQKIAHGIPSDKLLATFALSHLACSKNMAAQIISSTGCGLQILADCIRDNLGKASILSLKAVLNLISSSSADNGHDTTQIDAIASSPVEYNMLLECVKKADQEDFQLLALRVVKRLVQESANVGRRMSRDKKAIDSLMLLVNKGKLSEITTEEHEGAIAVRATAVDVITAICAVSDASTRFEMGSKWRVLEQLLFIISEGSANRLLAACDGCCGKLVDDAPELQKFFRMKMKRQKLLQLVGEGNIAMHTVCYSLKALQLYVAEDTASGMFDAKWLKRFRNSKHMHTIVALLTPDDEPQFVEAANLLFRLACPKEELLLLMVKQTPILDNAVDLLCRHTACTSTLAPKSALELLSLLCLPSSSSNLISTEVGQTHQEKLLNCGRKDDPVSPIANALLSLVMAYDGTDSALQKMALEFYEQLCISCLKQFQLVGEGNIAHCHITFETGNSMPQISAVVASAVVPTLLQAAASDAVEISAVAQKVISLLFSSAANVATLSQLHGPRPLCDLACMLSQAGPVARCNAEPTLLAVRANAIQALLNLRKNDYVFEPGDAMHCVMCLAEICVCADDSEQIRAACMGALADLELRLDPEHEVLSVKMLVDMANSVPCLRQHAALALCRRAKCSQKHCNELLGLQGIDLVLEMAEDGHRPEFSLDAAAALANILWLSPNVASTEPAPNLFDELAPSSFTDIILERNALRWILILAKSSDAPADHLLVVRAISTLCHTLPQQRLQDTVLHMSPGYDEHVYEGPIDTLVASVRKMLTRHRHPGLLESDLRKCQDAMRECFQTFRTLAKSRQNHTQLAGVRTLCEHLLSQAMHSEDVVQQARTVMILLDPDNPAAHRVDGGLSAVRPEHWTKDGQDHVEVELSRGSPEFQMCEQLINGNIAQHGGAMGRTPGTLEDPASFRVVRVVRIQDRHLYREYQHKRSSLRSKYADSLQFVDGSEWITDGKPILTDTILKNHQDVAHVCGRLDEKVNEKFLFHGTDARTAEVLKTNGFDARVASLIGMFGGGSYFAENSSKSNQYIPGPEANPPHGNPYQMLLCRVLLGDIHVCRRYDQTKYRGSPPHHYVRRPPNKQNSGDVYDSVMGECVRHGATATKPSRPLQFREFIVYDQAMAYPEYQIFYDRCD
jgi:hypothetical protein